MRIFQVDAFTSTRFTGNPASVVLDADGCDESRMRAIAREFSQGEVAYVLSPSAADHDVRLRFFNTRKEAPFVGHATIAAHAVLLALGRRRTGALRQLSGTGVLEVTAEEAAGDAAGATFAFRQSLPELLDPLPLKSTLRVAEALRLPAVSLHETLPARIARKGSTRLLVPVADPRALAALEPNHDGLVELGAELGAEGFFVFALHRDETEFRTESRMFCPAIGIPEDPVSGNAHAMLATYLWELGQFGRHPLRFRGEQGRFVGRPGEVDVRLETADGVLRAVHIGGRAVIVSEGTLAP